MCGICGYFGPFATPDEQYAVLRQMTSALAHRGPDDEGFLFQPDVGFGFRRLSFLDLAGGNQPLYNEDRTLALICNGEIYNYRELKQDLITGGHQFRTGTDVEVLLHLYEEFGVSLLQHLNGQFAFALLDTRTRTLFLARDHFGINPLYYTEAGGSFLFGSEIKALLKHPAVRREVDLTGLDQLLTFPGPVSPRTLFRNIRSVPPGHYVLVSGDGVQQREYWDLVYPKADEAVTERSEQEHVETIRELLCDSIRLRLHADVPVGFYLSGGLDSSLIAAMIHQLRPEEHLNSFAIDFRDRDFSEAPYQQLMAKQVQSVHHSLEFDSEAILKLLPRVIYHCESPIKETYNTASLALSGAARRQGSTAILTGEGADELFAGYVGYRFDRMRQGQARSLTSERLVEDRIRRRLWGDEEFFYEQDYAAARTSQRALYSEGLQRIHPTFDCLKQPLIDTGKVAGRHPVHQRSYIDCKVRMSDHLLSDHGDRMALANSVEARYPFLDIRLAQFATGMPPDLKLNGLTEKYALRRVAHSLVPLKIIRREKYAFVAPGSPHLLQQGIEWVDEFLRPERIRREGYFNPQTVACLTQQYRQPGFELNLPFERDFLIIVLTFGLFLQMFELPSLA